MKPYGAWREVLLARVERAEHELETVNGKADHAQHLLQVAKGTAETPGSLLTCWTGEQHERAWMNLHEAEAEIPEVLSEDELHVHSEEALKQAQAAFGERDRVSPSVRLIKNTDREPSAPPWQRRPLMQSVRSTTRRTNLTPRAATTGTASSG